MTNLLTISEAAARLLLPPAGVLRLILAKRLSFVHPEVDSPYFVPADEVTDLVVCPEAWAHRWNYLHPAPERVDLLEDWSE